MSIPPSDPPPPPSGPRLPPGAAWLASEPAVAQAVAAPPPEGDARPGASRAALYAYVGRRSTLGLVRRVVRMHVGKKTPKHVREYIESDAVTRMLEARSLPPREDAFDAWATVLTARATVDYFRRGATDLRWLRRDVEVEDQAAEPPDEEEREDDAWLLSNWLGEQVRGDAADQKTYEILLQKGRTARTYDDLATEHGMTLAALSNRIYRFKLKYLPIRHRHEKKRERNWMLLGLLLLGVGAAVAIWLVASRSFAPPSSLRVRRLAPTVVRVPAPVDPTFEPAGPPQAPLEPPLKPGP